MDIKSYIDSGILEDYVLGHVSEQEIKEVRCLSSIYPEIQSEVDAIESRLLNVSESLVDEMPALDFGKFMETIKQTSQEESDEKEATPRAIVKPTRTVFGAWQIAAAILLIVSVSAVWMVNNLNSNNARLADTNEVLRQEMGHMTDELNEKQLIAAIIADKDVKKITLKSTDPQVDQFASVYWNTRENAVYLNADNLPSPPEGSQYQLWKLKDGVPFDQGVIPINTKGLHLMNKAENADAFAITLEKEGGVESPTLTQLKVLGEV